MLLSSLSLDMHHLNMVLTLGIVIFGGIVGAKVFQKFHIPQVIGYLVIGLIIGDSCLGIVTAETIHNLQPINYFALGIIGFMIGGELKMSLFKKYGKQFSLIMFGEGLFAFFIVSAAATFVTWFFIKDIKMSLAIGIVFGSISSATDPASTLQVMWEYKTRGILTTATTAIVALDDALALALYGIGTSVAGILTGSGGDSVTISILKGFGELLGAILIGVAGGFVLNQILKRTREDESKLVFALGSVMLVIGLANALDLDLILSSMALGLTLVNIAPRRSGETFDLVKRISPPIYILFFVFVGAGIQISSLSKMALLLVLVYVIGRSAGKFTGAYLGSRLSGASVKLQKYLGFCLFAQGGVAIGLTIVASSRFASQPELASLIVVVVATTTLIVQILGPAATKFAVKKADEIGRNITPEDLIEKYTVADVMESESPTIDSALAFSQILKVFCNSSSLCYPVIDDKVKLLGVVTMQGIRETLNYQESAGWLVAFDVMQPAIDVVPPTMPLAEVIRKMNELGIEYMCVADEDSSFKGVVNLRSVNRRIAAEVLLQRGEV